MKTELLIQLDGLAKSADQVFLLAVRYPANKKIYCFYAFSLRSERQNYFQSNSGLKYCMYKKSNLHRNQIDPFPFHTPSHYIPSSLHNED